MGAAALFLIMVAPTLVYAGLEPHLPAAGRAWAMARARVRRSPSPRKAAALAAAK